MARRALLTGITGQDGSYLAEFLLAKGYEVHGLVRRLSVPNLTNIQHLQGRVTLLDGDLTDPASLVSAIETSQPHEVYNLAAQSFVGTSFKQPTATTQINGLGVVRLLDAITARAPDARFYQASTSELYGKAHEVPQRETTPFHPRSPYGYAKLLGYWATVNAREAGLHASNGILFNHESPRRGMEFVTRKIAHGVASIHLGLAERIELGNLGARRDWGYAPEYVEAMWRMLQQDEPADYVIATGESHSVQDFVQAAFAEVGIRDWEAHVRVDRALYRPTEVDLLCGDASRAHRALGWRPRTGFRELVRIMVRAEVERLEAAPHLAASPAPVTPMVPARPRAPKMPVAQGALARPHRGNGHRAS